MALLLPLSRQSILEGEYGTSPLSRSGEAGKGAEEIVSKRGATPLGRGCLLFRTRRF